MVDEPAGRRGRQQPPDGAADQGRGEEIAHRSAPPDYYDAESVHYDAFNEKNSAALNRLIERILRHHGARTVLDLTCGTGSQVFWLASRGFDVVGSDINQEMLRIARRKAKSSRVKLRRADMRTAHLGAFEAAITISNAVGHLTRADFERAIRNIRANLVKGGLYLFDILNLGWVSRGRNVTRLSMDRIATTGRLTVREVQYSVLEGSGVLASYTTYLVRRGAGRPRVLRSAQTLQIYTAAELRRMLRRNGFAVVRQVGVDGSALTRSTERILTIARKR